MIHLRVLALTLIAASSQARADDRWIHGVIGLGGGATQFDASSWHPAIVVDARLEIGERIVGGVDVSVGFLHGFTDPSGFDTQGTVLATVAARELARWFELGVGLGLHHAANPAGNGIAGSVSLRVHPSVLGTRAFGAFLRYDGAYLNRDGEDIGSGRALQHLLSIGVEYRL